ncbi:MAG: 50S ribosomal protein L13 [Acidobacteriota bacterium]|jgi:large subunit ribosomal protein L13
MVTPVPKKSEIEHQWLLVDADGLALGRLASFVAQRLRGKHRPTFTPHLDTGDHVIVINASRVQLSGGKRDAKLYRRHSGQPGNLKEIPFERMLERHPDRVVRLAVSGMLPKNRLGRQLIRKLKVYAGSEHPHQAQVPARVEVTA